MSGHREDPYIANMCGEEKLLVKILQQALIDLQSTKYKSHALGFFLNEDDKQPNSFIQICKALSINEDVILTKVKDYYTFGKPFARRENGNSKIPGSFYGENCNSEFEA